MGYESASNLMTSEESAAVAALVAGTYSGNLTIMGNLQVDGTTLLQSATTVSGVAKFADGAVGAPSVTFTTGLTSGFYHSGTTAGNDEVVSLAITGVAKFSVSKAGMVVGGASGLGSKLAVVETGATSPRGILSVQYSTDTNGARVGFAKARGTEASPATVATGDMLGRLMFRGYDGANFLEMASIEAGVSGTVGSTRVPTYIAFSTATDAAPSVLTERMRITNSGNVGIGTTAPTAQLDIRLASGYPQIIVGELGQNRYIGWSWDIAGQRALVQTYANTFGMLFGDATTPWHFMDRYGKNGIGTASPTAKLTVVQVAETSGLPQAFKLTSGAHTGLTTTAEDIGVLFDLSATKTWAAGNIATQREFVINAPTYAFDSASTITDAATVYISGAPIAGANATITAAYALWVDSGNSRFDGNITTARVYNTGGFGPTDVAFGTGAGVGMYFAASGLGFATASTVRLFVTSGGNVVVGADAAGTTAAKCLALTNGATAPSNSANLVHLYSADIAADRATLATWSEEAPAADVGLASTHSYIEFINGVKYKRMLVAV